MEKREFIKQCNFISTYRMTQVTASPNQLRNILGKEQFNYPELLRFKEVEETEIDGKTTLEWRVINKDTGKNLAFWDYKYYREIGDDEVINFSCYFEDEEDLQYVVKSLNNCES